MGAFAYTKAIREVLSQGAHGSTFGGSPLACAAGLAAIGAYRDEDLIKRSAMLGAHMRNTLRGALEGVAAVRDIRGLGLMIAVELRTKVAPVLKSLMLEHGVIALPAGPTVLRLLPPLVITESEIRPRRAGDREGHQGPEGVMERDTAIELIRGLVAIPSLSRQEAAASAWLVEQMRASGYERAFVDAAGNAVGEIGDPNAARTIVLLGHIDTVPGNIPVRIETPSAPLDPSVPPASPVLYGRERRREGAARHLRRGRRTFRRGACPRAQSPHRRRGRGGRRGRHQQGRALHRRPLQRRGRAHAHRVRDRRAQPLAPGHARVQGAAPAGPHRRSANGPHGGAGCQRGIGGRGSLELDQRARGARQRRARTRRSIS